MQVKCKVKYNSQVLVDPVVYDSFRLLCVFSMDFFIAAAFPQLFQAPVEIISHFFINEYDFKRVDRKNFMNAYRGITVDNIDLFSLIFEYVDFNDNNISPFQKEHGNDLRCIGQFHIGAVGFGH